MGCTSRGLLGQLAAGMCHWLPQRHSQVRQKVRVSGCCCGAGVMQLLVCWLRCSKAQTQPHAVHGWHAMVTVVYNCNATWHNAAAPGTSTRTFMQQRQQPPSTAAAAAACPPLQAPP